MAARRGCRDRLRVRLWVKALCGSSTGKNNPATTDEPSKAVVRRANRLPNISAQLDKLTRLQEQFNE